MPSKCVIEMEEGGHRRRARSATWSTGGAARYRCAGHVRFGSAPADHVEPPGTLKAWMGATHSTDRQSDGDDLHVLAYNETGARHARSSVKAEVTASDVVSAFPATADFPSRLRYVGFVPIVLQKSVEDR